ncbi:MAG: ATP synthase subunit delta [Micavibrio sp.]|nr:MAG: ATP synthase subunit delta [Micavibrio sp.]
MTTAPQASSIVATRYAAALIDLAAGEKVVDKVEKDLQALESMIESSEDLQSVIRSPLINNDQQEKAMAALAQKAGFQTLTQNFLGVLVQNGRLYALEGILKAAANEFSKRRGEISAQVQVANDLSAKQKEELQAVISKAIGSNVSLEVKVDPDILGGTIVTVGSRMIDDSVRRKLARLRSAMSKQANENVVTKIEEVG